jgi:hypothetical protein
MNDSRLGSASMTSTPSTIQNTRSPPFSQEALPSIEEEEKERELCRLRWKVASERKKRQEPRDLLLFTDLESDVFAEHENHNLSHSMRALKISPDKGGFGSSSSKQIHGDAPKSQTLDTLLSLHRTSLCTTPVYSRAKKKSIQLEIDRLFAAKVSRTARLGG